MKVKKHLLFMSLCITSFFAIMLIAFTSCSNNKSISTKDKKIKYVFLFIGDGMGQNHISLTEAYLASMNNKIGFEHLTMSSFPVFGQCETWCDGRLITDSGAAGSAIATSEKYKDGEISFHVKDSLKANFSIAKIAAANNYKVGIITTVSLNHATPAAFYASSSSRKNYYDIAGQVVNSNVDFFGGGGFRYPKGKDNSKDDVINIIKSNNYNIVNSLDSLSLYKNQKAIFINPVLCLEQDMPYSIDRQRLGGSSLRDIVKHAIDFLYNDNGFFMMVEGGKIDWAAHCKDAATLVHEVIDFDNAIKEAFDFYKKYPDETLIIVTADHETGGLSLGLGEKEYDSYFSILSRQTASVEYFTTVLEDYKKTHINNYNINDIIKLSDSIFYSSNFTLNSTHISKLKKAFDIYFNKSDKNNSQTASYDKYDSYNPIAISLSSFIRDSAAVGFTSWAHTAAKVPVYSIGNGSTEFFGIYDNTDISMKLLKLLNWKLVNDNNK